MAKRITLRASILVIYSTTFIVLTLSLMTVQSLTFIDIIRSVATKLLNNTSKQVLQELKSQTNLIDVLSTTTKQLIEHDEIDEEEMVNYSLSIARNTPHAILSSPSRITAWIKPNGDSVITFLNPDRTYSTALIKNNSNPPLRILLYRNLAGKIIRTEPFLSEEYDLRTHSWYLLALQSKEPLWTDVFLCLTCRNLSTAKVAPVYDKAGSLMGVFDIEIKLEGLSRFLDSLKISKNGIAFIINSKNELVAFPGMQKWMNEAKENIKFASLGKRGKPWLAKAVKYFDETQEHQFTYDYANEHYIASFVDIPDFSSFGWKIVVVIPENDFTATYKKQNLRLLIIGIGILLLGFFIVSFFSKKIANSLILLVGETNRIKNFDFSGSRVFSVIKEVDVLSNAIYSMKMNLHSFQKYMPSKLVQQLIQSGNDIQLGGEKKIISIFFSDIKNFTHIAETEALECLTSNLTEYWNIMSKIISKENGTIDKFIGDSLMVFWGAPIFDKEHCAHACHAALACKKEIDSLNQKWSQEGITPFITRFGLHTGEAIVGNIGSSERMNYTSIGDTVNFASRLEKINKIYGTSILSSEEVLHQVSGQFVFRKVDVINIRGKAGGYPIYELLCHHLDELPFDFIAYQESFEAGFNAYQQKNWDVAIKFFENAAAIYQGDTLAALFVSRCQLLKVNPPTRNWSGIWDNDLG